MNSINRRKKKNVFFKYFILILFLSFLALNYFKVEPFHSVVSGFSSTLIKTKNVILSPFDGFFSYFSSKKELELKNRELIEENSTLKVDVLSTQILKSEYKSLLNQIDQNKEVRIAKVLLKPPFSSFNNLTLSGNFSAEDVGQKIYYENIVLGEILYVENNTAIAKLFSASGNKVVGKLLDGNEFEVFGRGTGRYEMTLPKDVELKKGDPIAYPAENIVLIGIVNEVFATEDDLFNKVLFNIPVDFADINYVRIGSPKNILE